MRLVGHHAQVALALLFRQFDFLHGFQKAGEYRQRRA